MQAVTRTWCRDTPASTPTRWRWHVDPQDTCSHGNARLQRGTWARNSQRQKARTSFWSFLASLWRWEVGSGCKLHRKSCSRSSCQTRFVPAETFPRMTCVSTRGLEEQSLCNVRRSTHRNLIFASCSWSYANILPKKKIKKKIAVLSICLLHHFKWQPQVPAICV